MKFTKLIKAKDEGHFINNKGTWKKVIDKDIETNICGQTVQLKLWHFEVETESKDILNDSYYQNQHCTITNGQELAENIKNTFLKELANQLNATDCKYLEGIYAVIPTDVEVQK